MSSTRTRHEELGLPPGSFRHLAVSVAAGVLVVLYAATEDPAPIQRLYVRGFGETRYRQVDFLHPLNNYGRIVVAPVEPALYAVASRFEGPRGWDSSLVRVSLPDGASELVRVASPFEGRWWVAEVLGIDGSGFHLHLKVAEQHDLPAGGTRVDYSAQRLDLASGALTTLATLPALFA